MKKILVVDDEKGIVNFIKVYFDNQGYEVVTAYSAKEGLEKLNSSIEMILLDIMMPDMDGLTLCQQIREKVFCPIIFLSAKISEKDKIHGLAVGGDDYIEKPFSIKELEARVEAHFRREERKNLRHSISKSGFWIDYISKQVGYGDEIVNLTKKEYDIIEFLSLNEGHVFSKEQIYERIWGYDAEGDANVAVTEHIKRIRKKFHEDEMDKHIETVWGVGYRFKV